VEVPFQEAVFPVRREVHPHCKPREILRTKDKGDELLRNVSSFKRLTASSQKIVFFIVIVVKTSDLT
jgi:hypothetical protein